MEGTGDETAVSSLGMVIVSNVLLAFVRCAMSQLEQTKTNMVLFVQAMIGTGCLAPKAPGLVFTHTHSTRTVTAATVSPMAITLPRDCSP
jgi:hypothetical protein